MIGLWVKPLGKGRKGQVGYVTGVFSRHAELMMVQPPEIKGMKMSITYDMIEALPLEDHTVGHPDIIDLALSTNDKDWFKLVNSPEGENKDEEIRK